MEFCWANKKRTFDTLITLDVDLWSWALPIFISPHFGKFDKDLGFDEEGHCTFVKVKSTGWCGEVIIRILCFQLYIEINRWYDEAND